MRVLALRKAGEKEVTAKICRGLTEDQKREFVIKDNGSWGEWNYDELANEWSELPLEDWGVNLKLYQYEGGIKDELPEPAFEEKDGQKILRLMISQSKYNIVKNGIKKWIEENDLGREITVI
jgi:hypothetical protein